jgi:hypothetical protein
MSFSVELQDRSFTPQGALQGRYELTPEWYSWMTKGGPDSARIAVDVPMSRMNEVRGWLGYPVVIYNDDSMPVWWGLITGISVDTQDVVRTYDIREMANRVAVTYIDNTDGCMAQGYATKLPWLTDQRSYDMFGRYELIVALDRANVDSALANQSNTLRERRHPISMTDRAESGQPSIKLECRGWWWRFSRIYYNNPTSLDVLTTEQIRNVVRLCGDEFVSGVRILQSSNIKYTQYRDGNSTAADVMEEILDTGTLISDVYSRLLCTVGVDRVLEVYKEPAVPTDHVVASKSMRVLRGGKLYRANDEQDPEGFVPIAVWVDDADNASMTPRESVMFPRYSFIESAEYDVLRRQLTWRNRSQPDIWERGGLWREG